MGVESVWNSILTSIGIGADSARQGADASRESRDNAPRNAANNTTSYVIAGLALVSVVTLAVVVVKVSR